MNYHNITYDDMLNGDGLRTVLWVAGCEHKCRKCQNPITWDINGGIPFDVAAERELFTSIKDHTDGITFSGGDPLHPKNRDEVGRLAEKFKSLYPDKTIWLYTGYTFDFSELPYFIVVETGEIFYVPWIRYVDVVVDGRFDADVRKDDINNNKKVLWRGSSNQHIYRFNGERKIWTEENIKN